MQKFQEHGVILVDFFPDFSSAVSLGQRLTKDPGVLASQLTSSLQLPGFVKSSGLRSAAFNLRLWGYRGLQLRNYTCYKPGIYML